MVRRDAEQATKEQVIYRQRMKPNQEAKIYQFHSCTPGLTMEGAVIEEITNAHGQHYFKATAQIGTIFGSEVEGELTGIGSTREKALEKLAQEQHKLHESLWY